MQGGEKKLWQSVLLQAVQDAACLPSATLKQPEITSAKLYLKYNQDDFREVCELAGMDPVALRKAWLDGRLTSKVLTGSKYVHSTTASDTQEPLTPKASITMPTAPWDMAAQ